MKPLLSKRSSHFRLLRRIALIWLLSSCLLAAVTLFVEYRRLDQSVLAAARKESTVFTALTADYLLAPEPDGSEELQSRLAAALSHTSFVHVELLDADNQPLAAATRGPGSTMIERFKASGIIVPPGKTSDGALLRVNKQFFLYGVIPVHVSEAERHIGYVQGIYRVSLVDLRRLATGALVTLALGIGGISACAVLSYPGIALLHRRLMRAASDAGSSNIMLVQSLGGALAKCDTGDLGHHCRVIIYSVRLAERHGLDRKQIRDLILGACLHDLGMLPLEESIALQPGPLEEKQRRHMQQHVKNGLGRLKGYRWLKGTLPLLRSHHEKYDGSGYPAGLKHENIPVSARIFAIADAFDALSSNRPYRQAESLEIALRNMEQASGSHFDPVLLAAFIEVVPAVYGALEKLSLEQLEQECDRVVGKYVKT